MTYDSDQSDQPSMKPYSAATSGGYTADPQTGQFQPNIIKPGQATNRVPSNQAVLQAMMTAYLRKGKGGFTSEAPGNFLDMTYRVNPHNTYGIPLGGIQYGPSENVNSGSNPYSAIFNPAPSNDGPTGY